MGRKVGSFINPENGNTVWLDLGNLHHLQLIPNQIIELKNNQEILVTYRLESDDANKTILLSAEYDFQGKQIITQPQSIDEELFAKQLFDAICSDSTLDNAPTILEVKRIVLQEITDSLLNHGILTSNSVLSGIGFIYSDKTKIISIESFAVIAHQNGIIDIQLRDCVGTAILKNIINPSIEFFTSTHKFTISKYTIKEEGYDLVRNYTISTTNIDIEPITEKIIYEPIDFDRTDETSLGHFVTSRINLLNNGLSQKDFFDDMFSDIL